MVGIFDRLIIIIIPTTCRGFSLLEKQSTPPSLPPPPFSSTTDRQINRQTSSRVHVRHDWNLQMCTNAALCPRQCRGHGAAKVEKMHFFKHILTTYSMQTGGLYHQRSFQNTTASSFRTCWNPRWPCYFVHPKPWARLTRTPLERGRVPRREGVVCEWVSECECECVSEEGGEGGEAAEEEEEEERCRLNNKNPNHLGYGE